MSVHLTDDELLKVVIDNAEARCRCVSCSRRADELRSLLEEQSELTKDFSADVAKQIRKEKVASFDALLRETFLNLASGALIFYGAVLLFGLPQGAPVMSMLATDAGASYAEKLFTNERFIQAVMGNPLTVVSILVGVLLMCRAIVAYAQDERYLELLGGSALAFAIKPILNYGADILTIGEQINYRLFNAAAFSIAAELVLLFWFIASGYSLRQIQRGLFESLGLRRGGARIS